MIHILSLVLILIVFMEIKNIISTIKNHKHQKMVSNMIKDFSFRLDNGYVGVEDAKKELEFLETLSKMKLK